MRREFWAPRVAAAAAVVAVVVTIATGVSVASGVPALRVPRLLVGFAVGPSLAFVAAGLWRAQRLRLNQVHIENAAARVLRSAALVALHRSSER